MKSSRKWWKSTVAQEKKHLKCLLCQIPACLQSSKWRLWQEVSWLSQVKINHQVHKLPYLEYHLCTLKVFRRTSLWRLYQEGQQLIQDLDPTLPKVEDCHWSCLHLSSLVCKQVPIVRKVLAILKDRWTHFSKNSMKTVVEVRQKIHQDPIVLNLIELHSLLEK